MGSDSKSSKLHLAVFASGAGSNFKAIAEAIENKELHAEVAGLISNNPDVGALEFAQSRGILVEIINNNSYPDETEREQKILDTLECWMTNFVVLAGYMQKISTLIVNKFNNRIINIHPALLPSFGGKGMYGIRVHEAVIESGVQFSGVTVHLVNNKYDAGPIVLQRVVPVLDGDTPEILQKRILKEEHKIYKEAINLFCEDRVIVKGKRVFIKRNNA